MNGRPVRVAIYARVSTRDKDQDVELQLVPLREYVAVHGWEAHEYSDEAAAGDLQHRTDWQRLLADAARRRIDRVMVWKLDRAFRSTLHALSTLQELDHHRVGFASLTQPELDTTSATGRLVFTILAAVGEMERELIRDRVREGMRHAAAKGAHIGRPPVTSRRNFNARFERVRSELVRGTISRRKAARRLGIGTATLARLLGPSETGGDRGVDAPGQSRQKSTAFHTGRRRKRGGPIKATVRPAVSPDGGRNASGARPQTSEVGHTAPAAPAIATAPRARAR
ncbi:MAG TPA: recombinase family protein [Candidatus Limnocylindrales bacterium]|jgi:DNA invertase Pin-like site-specific DNA recombinase